MKLQAHDGVKGINLLGVEYLNDADGCIEVPDELAEVAKANGYTDIPPPKKGK